jgi:hypothetical protein
MASKKHQNVVALRIHGDNILECERALYLIADSFDAMVFQTTGPPYSPRFEIREGDNVVFEVQLFPGHGRWNVSLPDEFQSHGAPLREATDAVVTRLSADGRSEEVVLALEFCNALPAGNNAWQRNGRALACAATGVPYLYFAEVGGVELDENRVVKAPRFPNPIIPFSYLAASSLYDVQCLPVYSPSPSSSEAIRSAFREVFGQQEGKSLIRSILMHESGDAAREKLTEKALILAQVLGSKRKRVDTLRGEQWAELLGLKTAEDKAAWLGRNRMAWSKKTAGKVRTTSSFPELIGVFQKIGSISVASASIPLCLVPSDTRGDLAEELLSIYGDALSSEFANWVALRDSPLIAAWITGFKPRGDDSRPDRGLVPLARMLFGNSVDTLSIVYGPAKPSMWEELRTSPQRLANQNGLWEAIVNLSDGVLVDSATAEAPFQFLIRRGEPSSKGTIHFRAAAMTNLFTEHDVDSTLHMLFAGQQGRGVFEAMCNPPGGDWSGLSLLGFQTAEEFRWTSLPRVSRAGGKRPDHVIQFYLNDGRSLLLATESKTRGYDLEQNLGNRLRTYTRDLVDSPPTIVRSGNSEWRLWEDKDIPVRIASVISAGAFRWTSREELDRTIMRSQLDIAFAVEFGSVEQPSLLHVKATDDAQSLLPKIRDLVQQTGVRLEVEIH